MRCRASPALLFKKKRGGLGADRDNPEQRPLASSGAEEEAGEGTRISVRGAGPSLNQVSINGVALTGGLSGGGGNGVNNNSVDLSSFSADILSSIDVVKTAAADQDEGRLALISS